MISRNQGTEGGGFPLTALIDSSSGREGEQPRPSTGSPIWQKIKSGKTGGERRRVYVAAVWALGAAVMSGMLIGMVTSDGRIGEWGFFLIWPLGAGIGHVGRKLVGSPRKVIGRQCLRACGVAVVFAMVWWLRWNTVEGDQGWLRSMAVLPRFWIQYLPSTFMAALAGLVGGSSAWRQATRAG